MLIWVLSGRLSVSTLSRDNAEMPFPQWECWTLPVGFALDAVVGDPRGWPHPVRLIGGSITTLERLFRGTVFRPTSAKWIGYVAGLLLVVVVTGGTGLVVVEMRQLASRCGGIGLFVADSLLIYWGLAVKGLAVESLRASEAADLDVARAELSMIVGRDTQTLDRPEICRACVETVAENGNDAVVAPLFWFAIGGPVGLWMYKAVNTLDSMVGYRDFRYAELGWASARLDDLVNLIPSRITWLLIALASSLTGENASEALRIGWRDGRKHPSPNAAWGEAAMAGALHVQLGGIAFYRGVVSEKPRLGDQNEAIGPATVRRAVKVMKTSALLAAILAGSVRAWLLL